MKHFEMKKYDEISKNFNSAWESLTEKQEKECEAYNEDYRIFLDRSKTERLCVDEVIRRAEAKGYVSLEYVLGKAETPKKGMKIYAANRNKSIVLFHIGSLPISNGVNIVGGHIDSPRLDLKPNPLYEEAEIGFMKTHYYGGIKKYQWATLPLALHGAVFKPNGEQIRISVGEEADDPVFCVSDLLPHLGKDQSVKKMGEGIEGEQLNIIVGNKPLGGKDVKEKVKYHVLSLLHQKYGITEKDFLTAEFEVVPAGKARELGMDRSMIIAYGQDDRSCSFAALKAILDIKSVEKTAVVMLMDKEEVGSQGNTGSESRYFDYVLAELMNLQEKNYSDLYLRRCMQGSQVLSADVGAAFDPNYAYAYEKRNSGMLGKGLQLVKYTGSRGKGGCNDANAEFLATVADIFDQNGVVWQIGELGKIDQGGGGTIAYILANAGAEVVDCGIPVISMHAPHEVTSKVDNYMAFLGYRAFLKR